MPICPELHEMLLAAFDQAEEGEGHVIPAGTISVKNISRDFNFFCKRVGMVRYSKPLHTLRKSCITDWANRFPAHVVKQGAGHSDLDITDRYYLQVSEAEYERAAVTRMSLETTQLPTQLADNEADSAGEASPKTPQPPSSQELPETKTDNTPDHDSRLTYPAVALKASGPPPPSVFSRISSARPHRTVLA